MQTYYYCPQMLLSVAVTSVVCSGLTCYIAQSARKHFRKYTAQWQARQGEGRA